MVEVKDLSKSYGRVQAIDRISFSISEGEVVGLLGPNGAGKSTTMRILTGLIPATSGWATIKGISVASHPERIKQHLGYMPENNPLPGDMRVMEYLRFRGALKGLHGRALRKRVEEVMDLCDLARKAKGKLIRTLSKGFRQRVGIADTLLNLPGLIILDEPTIGLDPHQIRSVRSLIQDLKGRMSVILSSHILPEIEQVCDRCIIINRGQVVAAGTPSHLRSELLPGQQFEITFSGSPTETEFMLRKMDPDLQVNDSYPLNKEGLWHLRFSSDDLAIGGPEIIRAFQASKGADLYEVKKTEASLEDIFIAATRRGWESAGTPSEIRQVETAPEGSL